MTENVRFQKLRNFIVKVCNSEDATVGTGIVVSIDGKIVTCAHVAEAALGVHPREAMGREIHVYFPQVGAAEKKARIATVDGCFPQHDDDVVLLQLKDGPAPLEPEQIAQLGRATGSEGNKFQSYGFASIGSYKSRYASGEIQGPVELDLPNTRFQSDPVQLKTEDIRPGMSGSAVLDKKRNLVIGLVTERWNPQGKTEDDNIAWATDNYVLTFDPIKLPLRDESLPMGPAFRPNVDLEAAKTAIAPKQKHARNNAPASIQEWVGRADFLKSITNDWIDSRKRITGLIGFGGEGKSSLARRWIDDIRKDTTLPQPDGIFWWGFYNRPSVDEFFEVALDYLSGGNVDLARLYPSSSARVHLLAGMLYGGRYLFVLDGLEGLQHQEGDQFGLLKSNDLQEFLQFFASPDHESFCIVTSRVPLLDMMEYTTYQHRDVERLNAADGRALLNKLGVIGDDEELDKVVADWDGHALTLSLIGSYIADQYNGDISHIKDLPPPTAGEPRYERVHRVLRQYDEHLDNAEKAFLKLFSVFRIPVNKADLDKIFRPKSEKRTSCLIAPIIALDDAKFLAMVDRLVAYRILRLEPSARLYSIHPLIRDHYFRFLTEGGQEQIEEANQLIKDYYLARSRYRLDVPNLRGLRPLIELVHHTCECGSYDEALNIHRVQILRGNEFYLTHKLGAWKYELEIMQEFFPGGDFYQAPLVTSFRDKGWVLNEVGLSLDIVGKGILAEGFFERALKIDVDSENWRDASVGYRNLSMTHLLRGELAKGLEFATESLEMAKRAKLKDLESASRTIQAWANHLQGNLEEASRIFSETGPSGIYLADHLRRRGDAKNSRRVIETTLKGLEKKFYGNNCDPLSSVRRKNLYISDFSKCYRVLGDLYVVECQWDSARDNYKQALDIASKTTNRVVLMEALQARGRWEARNLKNAKAAFSDLTVALDYAKEGDYRLYETDIRVGLAWAHLAASDKDAARKEARHAKQMSDDTNYYWGNKDADEVLAEIEKA